MLKKLIEKRDHFREEVSRNPNAYWGRRLIIFLLIVGLMLFYLVRVFDMNDTKHSEQVFQAYYKLPKNTVDVVYTGSSAAYRYYSPYMAWAETGITSFDLNSASQPIILQEPIINEALKTQKPKVIVIEVRNILKIPDSMTDTAIRRVTDAMHWSRNRNAAIRKALKYYRYSNSYDAETLDKASYYFPFLKYHGRWNDDIHLSDWKAVTKQNAYMGQVVDSALSWVVDDVKVRQYDDYTELNSIQKKTIRDLLNYCDRLTKRSNVKILFVSSPFSGSKEDYGLINSTEKMITGRGYTFLNFNDRKSGLAKAIDVNQNTDFCDERHANIIGMTKFSNYMSRYLQQHYNLKDHRNDTGSAYGTWRSKSESFYTTISLWARSAGYDAVNLLQQRKTDSAEIQKTNRLIQKLLSHVPEPDMEMDEG